MGDVIGQEDVMYYFKKYANTWEIMGRKRGLCWIPLDVQDQARKLQPSLSSHWRNSQIMVLQAPRKAG